MIRPIDNVYRQGVNAVVTKAGVGYWYNVNENTAITLTEEFVEEAIEEKVRREYLGVNENEDAVIAMLCGSDERMGEQG